MKTLQRLLLGALAGGFCLLALEGLAHLALGPPPHGGAAVVPPEVGCFDPDLGWSLRPGARAVSTRTGRPVEYRINARGVRGPDVPLAKPPGTFRIVALGDSRTFGFGVPEAKRYTDLLPGWFRELEVVNLGVSGFGVDQELLRLRRDGLAYEPDLVLLYVAHFGSERHMHARRFGHGKPRFVLEDGELHLVDHPVPPPAEGEGYGEPSRLRALHRWLRRRSTLYALVRDGVVGLLGPDEARAAGVPAGPDAPGAADGGAAAVLELGRAIVLAIAAESRAHGAAFLLVTQVPELADAAREAGLATLEPTLAVDNRRLALPDGFGHLDEAGNGVLAWECARALVTLDLVPASHRRGSAGDG